MAPAAAKAGNCASVAAMSVVPSGERTARGLAWAWPGAGSRPRAWKAARSARTCTPIFPAGLPAARPSSRRPDRRSGRNCAPSAPRQTRSGCRRAAPERASRRPGRTGFACPRRQPARSSRVPGRRGSALPSARTGPPRECRQRRILFLPPDAEAEIKATAGDEVERGGLLGQEDRRPQGRDQDTSRQANPRGEPGKRRQQGQRLVEIGAVRGRRTLA